MDIIESATQLLTAAVNNGRIEFKTNGSAKEIAKDLAEAMDLMLRSLAESAREADRIAKRKL